MQTPKIFALMTGLTNALRRMDAYAKQIPMDVNPAAAALAIVNPLSGRRSFGVTRLFSTHPPTKERIAWLEALSRSDAVR